MMRFLRSAFVIARRDGGVGRESAECLDEDRTLVTTQRPGGARVRREVVRRELVVAEAIDR